VKLQRRASENVVTARPLKRGALHEGAAGASCATTPCKPARAAPISRPESGGRPGGVDRFEYEGETPMTDITYGAAPAGVSATERKSLLARALDALIEARMRQARRQISLHLGVAPDEVAKQVGVELDRARTSSRG
jgi:hypothetical protein